ncbi:MAG TPA: hypothetical protein VMC06_07700 [Opitutaceae bacterium]|nr:hypothetical protein [Opitutaceae bacterium]
MKNLTLCFATVGLSFLALSPVRAAFDPAIVGADAKWVVFLDVNELRESALGKELIGTIQKDVQSEMAQSPLQIDFTKILASISTVTAYGANFSPEANQTDGSLVIRGTADLRKIAEALVVQATVTTPERVTELKDLPFTAYAIHGQVIVAFPPEQVILVSKSKPQLLKALEVFRGKSPSLAQTPSSPLRAMLTPAGHAYVVAASLMPTEKWATDEGPHTRILQMVNSGSLTLGADGPRTAAYLCLVANSDDMADKLLKIVQGLTAIAALTETNDKQLTEFLQSAAVEKQDLTVTVHLAYATDRLVQMIQNAQSSAKAAGAPGMPGATPANAGKVVAEWKPDQAPVNTAPGAALLATRTIENVHLVNGATISLVGRRDQNGSAIFDFVEIAPMPGTGSPLHFEAEKMRLSGYRVQDAPYASRGKFIVLQRSFGSAQFEFPGEDGDYVIRVRYLEETPGKTTLSVNVRNPEPAPESP